MSQSKQKQVIEEENQQAPKSAEDKLDDCIEQLGGFGKFQLFAYFSVSASINSVGFWFYQLAYLMQEPKYKCEIQAGVSADGICTSENICAKDSRILRWEIDWDHENSLHNWHE